jgi:hypothetical protein
MTEEATKPAPAPPQTVNFGEFLERIPPGRNQAITPPILAGYSRSYSGEITHNFGPPEIEVFCDSENCQGVRFFKTSDTLRLTEGRASDQFLDYVCKNCGTVWKTYALRVRLEKDRRRFSAMKFGEQPTFGPPTSAKLITLIGPDRDYFLKGRRCENQDLGIAAFAYYRRVVENQKDRIIQEIIKVAEKLNAAPETIEELKVAMKETQFTKAVEAIKHGLPQVLLVKGQNPLLLLHDALSAGLHSQSDEECLAIASSIRIVLMDLAENLAHALKEEAELGSAVTKLLQVRKPKEQKAEN